MSDAHPRANREVLSGPVGGSRLIESWSELAFILLAYLGVAIWATWPMVIKPTGGFYGFGNDNWGGIWFLGWLNRAYWGPESPSFTDQLQAPFGYVIPDQVIHPYTRLMALLFGGIDQGLFAYNLQIFISFILAGVTMYLLVKDLTGNKRASFLAGFIFTFSPFHLAVAMQYDIHSSIQWLPLYFLVMLRFFRTHRVKYAVYWGLSFALVTTTNYYYAWFLLWATIVVFLVYSVYWIRRNPKPRLTPQSRYRRLAGLSTLAAVVGAVAALPVVLPSLQTLTQGGSATVRPVEEAIRYSARPWMLFVPTHDNPFVSGGLGEWIHNHLFEMASYEQAIYLGYAALFLALIGLFAPTLRKSRRLHADRLLLGSGIVMGLIIMMGPYLPLSDTYWRYWSQPEITNHVPSLGLLIFKIGPIFRFFVRAFVIVSVCLAALAGIGYAVIELRISRASRQWGLCVLLMFVVALEFTNAPPHQWYSDATPPWVEEVRGLPSDASIVQYPAALVHSPRALYYIFWQREHGRRTANPFQSPASMAFLSGIADPNASSTGEALYRNGISFAVIHVVLPPLTTTPYQPYLPHDAMAPGTGKGNPWFELYSHSSDSVIYRIRPPVQDSP